jgi:hypothetical protein
MDRIDLVNAFWAILDLTVASISTFLATHEVGEPWHILHWILAIIFFTLCVMSVWGLVEDFRRPRAFQRLKS